MLRVVALDELLHSHRRRLLLLTSQGDRAATRAALGQVSRVRG